MILAKLNVEGKKELAIQYHTYVGSAPSLRLLRLYADLPWSRRPHFRSFCYLARSARRTKRTAIDSPSIPCFASFAIGIPAHTKRSVSAESRDRALSSILAQRETFGQTMVRFSRSQTLSMSSRS